MLLETQRLLLRGFTVADQADFNDIVRDKMASPMAVYDHDFPTDDAGLRETLAFFSANEAFMAVVHRGEKRVIGFVTLHPAEEENVREIGYCLHSRYQRQGYAAEAVSALIDYARGNGVKKLVCGTARCNVASVRLAQWLGFTLVAEGMTALAIDDEGKPVNPFMGCIFELAL